jgi:2,3,4,5-tetrahydropyridine-2-carboxylate N-succinyltransferase
VDTKFEGWEAARFEAAGFRAVPGCVVRKGAFIARNVVLMPSFVNIGAFVDEGTMVDTWATVGSCAQIGKNVHLSGGAGIGGVLEPLQANPTIIEDNCFIGARSEVAEGVIVREGSVLSMGVYLTSTTPIIDRRTGEVFTGEVPPYSVVMSGSRPSPHEGLPGTYCAVIMKTVDEPWAAMMADHARKIIHMRNQRSPYLAMTASLLETQLSYHFLMVSE